MPEIEFTGDWTPEEAEQAAHKLRKSLGFGFGNGIPDDLNPSTIAGDLPNLLSKRQKRLLALLQSASAAAIDCDEDEPCDENRPDWDDYTKKLHKAAGQIKITSKGRYRLNQNQRWERLESDRPVLNMGEFEFPVSEGEFGRGVYFPVAQAAGEGVRLRLRLAIEPDSFISDEDFFELEDSLTLDTELMLDSKGVRAIAKTNGDSVVLLCVRDKEDIVPLGIVAGSGQVPTGEVRFNLISVEPQSDHVLAEVEMVDAAAPLNKSAKLDRRSTLQSSSFLHGTKLVQSSAPPLDRTLVKRAIERCKLDGIDFSDIHVRLVRGKPDFLNGMVRAFCLPSDGVIHLCPHDPQAAIATLARELSVRLQTAVRAGAMLADDALELMARASQLNPEWWLEMLLKRYVGAIECDRKFNILNGGTPPRTYMNLLVARGAGIWSNRRLLAECMAEDFRVAHDPAGLPNLVTLEWDIAVPSIAREAQSKLLKSIQHSPL